MNIKVKKNYENEFLAMLKLGHYELQYSDEFGYYRIFDKKERSVLVGKFKIWNNVVEYYLGQAQLRFINDLIISYNKYLEYYEK